MNAAPNPADVPADSYATGLFLIQAHIGSRLMGIAAKLGIPDLLAEGPRTAEALAETLGMPPRGLFRLLRGLTTCGIVRHRDDGSFELSPLGHCLRTRTRSLRDLAIRTHDVDCPAWDRLLDAIKDGSVPFEQEFGSDFYSYLLAHADVGRAFHRAMAVTAASIAHTLVAAYEFPRAGTVIDVGGGSGGSLSAILRACPGLCGVLFDLSPALAQAETVLAAAGVMDRCRIVAGDMFAAIPTGGDIYLVKLILHNWSDAPAARILAQCRRVMSSAARLLIAERIMPERADEAAASPIVSDLSMFVLLGGGERTETEYAALLAAAGFEVTRVTATNGLLSLIEARPR